MAGLGLKLTTPGYCASEHDMHLLAIGEINYDYINLHDLQFAIYFGLHNLMYIDNHNRAGFSRLIIQYSK